MKILTKSLLLVTALVTFSATAAPTQEQLDSFMTEQASLNACGAILSTVLGLFENAAKREANTRLAQVAYFTKDVEREPINILYAKHVYRVSLGPKLSPALFNSTHNLDFSVIGTRPGVFKIQVLGNGPFGGLKTVVAKDVEFLKAGTVATENDKETLDQISDSALRQLRDGRQQAFEQLLSKYGVALKIKAMEHLFADLSEKAYAEPETRYDRQYNVRRLVGERSEINVPITKVTFSPNAQGEKRVAFIAYTNGSLEIVLIEGTKTSVWKRTYQTIETYWNGVRFTDRISDDFMGLMQMSINDFTFEKLMQASSNDHDVWPSWANRSLIEK